MLLFLRSSCFAYHYQFRSKCRNVYVCQCVGQKSINEEEALASRKVSATLYKRRFFNSDFTSGQTVTISIMNALTAVIFCVLVAGALSAPPSLEPIPILKQALDGPNPDGSYSYSYETANGIQAQEQGQLAKISKDEDANHVQGSFSYPDADGKPIALTYIADENGFQPSGAHLPVPPAVPANILKALEYIAKHPEEDNL